MRTILYCLILCISFSTTHAQLFPTLSFQKFYDNLGDDIPNKILKSMDGNLIIGGTTWQDDVEEEANIFIVKVDPAGDIIWERNIGIAGVQELRDMTLTAEGEVIFVGVSTTLINHEESGDDTYWGDFIVGRLDKFGQVVWLQSYGGRNLDQANAIVTTPSYDFLIAGSTHSRNGDIPGRHGMSDVWVLQIDDQGNKGLNRTYGGTQNDWATAISMCKNGDFLLAGFTNSPELSESQPSMYGNGLIMRVAQSGQQIWKTVFHCPEGGYFKDITENEFGEIFVVGTRVNTDYVHDFWWMLLDDRGDPMLEFTPLGPNNEWMETLDKCTNGGFIMGGYGKSQGINGPYTKGKDDFWLVRTDPQGRVVWRNTYGGPDNERCRDVIEYAPGIFYAVGEKVNDFQRGISKGKDFWLLKIEEKPCESLESDIFVRAEKFRGERNKAIRFRAKSNYGNKFYWTFGDGTTSETEDPLKTYDYPGVYRVSLTVFTNENCQQTVWLPKPLKID